MNNFATPTQVKKFAEALPTPYLKCRQYSHSWNDYTVDKVGSKFIVVTLCPRCESKRITTLSRTGAILKSHYDYSEGYLTHDIGRIAGGGRNALRLVGVNRILSEGISTVDAKPKSRKRLRAV